MAHPVEDLVRRGYQAFAEEDIATLDELFADDITWHSPGNTPFSGDFEGKQAVLENLAKVTQLTDSFSTELHDVLANDDHGVALVKQRMERDGKHLEVQAVHVFHHSNGQVTSAWLHPYDQQALDRFWE